MNTTAVSLGFLSAVLLGSAHAVVIPTVLVNDPGNAADTANGVGAVRS